MIRRFPSFLLSGTTKLRRGYVSMKMAVLNDQEYLDWVNGSKAAQERLEKNPKEMLRFFSHLSEATTSTWAPRIYNDLPQEQVENYKRVLEWESEIIEILKPTMLMQARFPTLNLAEGQKVRSLVQKILNLFPTYGSKINPAAKDTADVIFIKGSVRSIFEEYFMTGYKVSPNQKQLRYFEAAQSGVVNVGILRELKNTEFQSSVIEDDISKYSGEELLALFEVNWAVEPFRKSTSLESIRSRFEAIIAASVSKADAGYYKTQEGLQVVSRKLETKTFARLVSRICDKYCSPTLIKLIEEYIRQNSASLGSEDLTMSLYGLARNSVNEAHLDWVNNKLPNLVINNSGCFALVISLAAKLYEVVDAQGKRPFFQNQETFLKFLQHMESLIERQDTLASRYNSRYLLVAVEKLASMKFDKKLIPVSLLHYLNQEFIQHKDSYESHDDQVQMTYFLVELGIIQNYGKIAEEIATSISDQTETSPEKITLGMWMLYRLNRLNNLPVPRKVREVVAMPLSRDSLKKALDTDRLRRRLNEVIQMEAEYVGESILSEKELQQEELIAKALWNSKSFSRTGWVVQQDLRAGRQQPKPDEEKPKIEEAEFTIASEPAGQRKPLRFERSWRSMESDSEDD
jgi:hypothetical protein